MVGLKEWPPHLKEVQVSDGGDDNVKLIFQKGCRGCGSPSHCSNREKREGEREREDGMCV